MEARVLLCVLDGWGIPQPSDIGAITQDTAPFFYDLKQIYGCAHLQASGAPVGLPEGVQGNSEVGHLTMGLGRPNPSMHSVVTQALNSTHLEQSLEWKSFLAAVKKKNNTVHILTMLSDGYIHADIRHFISVARMIQAKGISIKLHAILDGRDTPSGTAQKHLALLAEEVPFIDIVTLMGRAHCMDRGGTWPRTLQSYNTIVHGANPLFSEAHTFLTPSFKEDEFLSPCAQHQYSGFDYSQDTFLFLNFRADRMVQIVSALCDPNYSEPKPPAPQKQEWKSIAPYTKLPFIDYLLPHPPAQKALGHTLLDHQIKQARISESEKTFHVTYFFDGQNALKAPLIHTFTTPSFIDETSSYDPNMPTNGTTRHTLDALEDPSFRFILVNLASCDLLGHTGNTHQAAQGVSCVDRALSHIVHLAQTHDVVPIITADHGNAEVMEKSGSPHTGHTLNQVPLIIASHKHKLKRTSGSLQDVAPTILDALSIAQPSIMTGKSFCAD